MRWLLAMIFGATMAHAAPNAAVFSNIDGGTVDLADYAGQPVLVVNTASQCGYVGQYVGLQRFYDSYKDRGLVVLAVPSDDFNQELADGAAIKDFCEVTFGLTLPMTDITHVRGPDAHAFYKSVKAQTGFVPGWNFNKVLIGPDGAVMGSWGAPVAPQSPAIVKAIEPFLKARQPVGGRSPPMSNSDKEPDLKAAYAVQTPDDNRKLYADWARTYDARFAVDMDYQLPRLVALILAEVYDGPGPVLDVGAGTGLVAQNMLTRGTTPVDALDISEDMLAVAAEKKLYRETIQGDLTAKVDIADGSYDALVSAGTFTRGHVGPEALDELLRIARPGATFVLAVNHAHFEARGFGDKFRTLEGKVEDVEQRVVHIYGEKGDAAHKDDTAQIAVFRKIQG